MPGEDISAEIETLEEFDEEGMRLATLSIGTSSISLRKSLMLKGGVS